MIPKELNENVLLQDGEIGRMLRKHFPDAKPIDFYSAGITFDSETGEIVSLSCKGRKIKIKGRSDD